MKEYVISVDLGGTNVRVGLISSDLEIIKVNREPSIKKDKIALANQICRLISYLPYQEYNVKKVGISACGFIENDHINHITNLELDDFDLKGEILKKYPFFNVRIINDANCTALSEALFGASKDYQTSYFVTMSTGVGGGFIYNKNLIDLPFEIGNEIISYKGENYYLEKLLSGTGIVKLCALNSLKVNNAFEFFTLVRENNSLAKQILNDWIRLTSEMLFNIQIIFNTDCIVLSGGVMKSQDLFFDQLIKESNILISKYPMKKINLVLAKFDQDAGLIGGASVALVLEK